LLENEIWAVEKFPEKKQSHCKLPANLNWTEKSSSKAAAGEINWELPENEIWTT
jgi:hypothetical protein